MRTQTLKERVVLQKAEFDELAKAAEMNESCGRDSKSLTPRQSSPLNWQNGWDKGWNNYGKT